MPDDLNDVLSLDEVVAILAVSRRTIERLIREGQLPSMLVPAPASTRTRMLRRVSRSDLEMWIREHTR